jgi:peptidoglycan/xylan/chitin deacetylase (PgdA/CDA1 family)
MKGREQLTRVALGVLRRSAAGRDMLIRARGLGGKCLVLCYHTIAPDTGGDRAMDPVPPQRFAEHLRALKDVGDIVPLSVVLSPPIKSSRPMFAVTFDDDDPAHVRYALPILRDLQVPATFFLSGRAMAGLGPYWWTLIEQSAAELGLAETCKRLGHKARSIRELTRKCRIAGTTPELATHITPPVMRTDDIRTLANAGMTIGFHTLRHFSLPDLDDEALEAALSEGRNAVGRAAGVPIEFLAYPYGRADARVADAARRLGYEGAVLATGRAVRPGTDPMLMPRWQPGAIDVRSLLAEASLRLAATR